MLPGVTGVPTAIIMAALLAVEGDTQLRPEVITTDIASLLAKVVEV